MTSAIIIIIGGVACAILALFVWEAYETMKDRWPR
jgi:hypothetical protein